VLFRKWCQNPCDPYKICLVMLVAVMMQHSLTLTSCNGIFYRPVLVILRIHILIEMTQSFVAKQNQYGIDFSCHHHMKVPIHKIKFCFTICWESLWTTVVIQRWQLSSFLSFCNDPDTQACCANCIKDFLGDACSWAPSMFTWLRTCFLRVLFGSKFEPIGCRQC
jgi:hypothetical protein